MRGGRILVTLIRRFAAGLSAAAAAAAVPSMATVAEHVHGQESDADQHPNPVLGKPLHVVILVVAVNMVGRLAGRGRTWLGAPAFCAQLPLCGGTNTPQHRSRRRCPPAPSRRRGGQPPSPSRSRPGPRCGRRRRLLSPGSTRNLRSCSGPTQLAGYRPRLATHLLVTGSENKLPIQGLVALR